MNIFTKSSFRNLNRLTTFSLIILGVLLFNSCKKETDTTADGAFLSIINASPTLATYNVYLNDSKANSAALPFGGRMSYMQLVAGDFNVKFTTASSIDNIFTKSVSLGANTIHSFYLINKAPNIDGLLVTDDLSAVSTDKAFIRFINLSPDAPALSLAVTDATTNTISDKAFKAVSGWVTVDPKTYSFDIKTSTGLIKTTLSGATVIAGGYYTIIARGLLSPGDADQPFSAQILTNQ